MGRPQSEDRRIYQQIRLGEMEKTVTMAGSDLQNLVLRPGKLYVTQGAPATTDDGTAVVTAANIMTGVITCLATQARSKATDTAANLISGLSLDTDGDSFDFSLINTAPLIEGAIVTLTAGTGVTLVGAMYVLPSHPAATGASGSLGSAMFRVRRTSSTAVSIYRLS